MRKFFLIPLMTLMCSVMAWGTEIVVDNFDDLKTQLSSEGTYDVVKLGADITYGSELLNIQRSLTLDGNGFTINGNIVGNFSVSNDKTFNKNAIFAVNKGGTTDAGLVVTIQNLELTHSSVTQREIPFVIFDGVTKFTLNQVKTHGNNKDFQSLLITGTDNTPVQLIIKDSEIDNLGNYAMYILKPITATLTNTTISGYCGMYFKYQWSSGSTGYGNTVGSAGSVVNADACTFNCPNPYAGSSNNFAIFPIEDHNITLNLHNCSFNADNLASNDGQRLVNLQYNARSTNLGDVYVNISGDNTHIYNIENNNPYKLIWNGFVVGQNTPSAGEGLSTKTATDLHVTISGGTLNVNPEGVHWITVADNKPQATSTIKYNGSESDGGTGAITIASGYEVNTINQGGTTLYRVTKAADGTAINDNAGQNETKTIEVATGGEVALANETTEAGYVQVKNEGENATHVTVAKNNVDPEHSQTLIVNNGLDVLGTSTVTVQPTAALVVGEGGITTQSASSIVIEADEDGSASLLLHPAITVNQTPELTVKMKAHVGKISTNNYEWHRFAMPVDEISSLPSTAPTSTTAIFTWDHAAQGGQGDWVSISALSDLDPFKGYTLTVDYDGVTDYVYTFAGRLTGNINTDLQLTHQGYNFFGNSYTGYIKLATLADAIIGNADLDATVWAWDSEHQVYGSVSLRALQEAEVGNYAHLIFPAWKREIAPMQTFILRLPNTDNATAEVDYASAIWGNPRYSGSTSSSAPARMAEIDGSIISMSISSENGSADNVLFMEKNAYSDDFENGYDAMKYMNENAVNMFVTVNGEDLSAVATDAIEGKMLTIQTGKAVNYTLTIDAALGAEYAIRDNVTNQVIAIEEGATYEFAAQPNSTIAGRFEIVGRAQMPTAIENTEVKANVKGIYTIMGQYLGEDFDILPAGVYVVDGVKIVK